MHMVLRGLGPSFQHIRNGDAGAKKQDAATLERLLDPNNAATDLLQAHYRLPSSPKHSHQCFQRFGLPPSASLCPAVRLPLV